MANVFLIGLREEVAGQIDRVVSTERHTVYRKRHSVGIGELSDAGIVFAGGSPGLYMPLLWRVRKELPMVPFVVITDTSDTTAWLNALEAGATDYCCAPIARRQIQWLMESIMPATGAGLDVEFPRG